MRLTNEADESWFGPQMDHFSQSLEEDKMAKVRADMDDVKNVMVDNIEKVKAHSYISLGLRDTLVVLG